MLSSSNVASRKELLSNNTSRLFVELGNIAISVNWCKLAENYMVCDGLTSLIQSMYDLEDLCNMQENKIRSSTSKTFYMTNAKSAKVSFVEICENNRRIESKH